MTYVMLTTFISHFTLLVLWLSGKTERLVTLGKTGDSRKDGLTDWLIDISNPEDGRWKCTISGV